MTKRDWITVYEFAKQFSSMDELLKAISRVIREELCEQKKNSDPTE